MIKQNLLVLFCLPILFGCSHNDSTEQKEQRTFYMGTTPWPADLTIEEVNKTYDFINTHCDIVSHHINEGIPYEELYNNLPLPGNLLNDMALKKAKTASSKNVFLSVAALNIDRISKDRYYDKATTPNDIKAYWESLPFDDPKVITAYVRYIDWLIEQLDPIYVNYGVESNSSNWSSTDFARYRTFLSQVYTQLKAGHPSISFFVSFMVSDSLGRAEQLLPYTDFIGLSAYPYYFSPTNSDPKNIPDTLFENFINLDANKPWVFAETGYIAQNLVIPEYNLNKQGTPVWQNEYLEQVLQLCQNKRAKMFIWFCPKDYDALLTTFENQGVSQENLATMKLWRDTGLIDEQDVQRPAYHTWLQWMAKEKTE